MIKKTLLSLTIIILPSIVFAQDLSSFMHSINEITRPADEVNLLVEQCNNGNRRACEEIGMTPTEESVSSFISRTNKLTAPADRYLELIENCAEGNDRACTKVGIDTNDPCRAYMTSPEQHYACRAHLCRQGSQNECRKIAQYNNMLRYQQRKMQRIELERKRINKNRMDWIIDSFDSNY